MKVINPGTLPSPRGYNNGILAPCGKILFVAGQIGWDRNGRMADGLIAQFDRALANILEVVREAGGQAQDINGMTIFLKNKQDYLEHRKEIGQAYRSRMGRHFPAMSLVIVNDLLEDGALIEIEATAVLP